MTLARRFVRSSAFRSLETIVQVATGLFMLPFLLSHLGQDTYGLWIIVTSVTSSFYIFDLGFGSAITRYIAVALGARDREQATEIVSTALVVYSLLALLILLATGVTIAVAESVVEKAEQLRLAQALIAITGLGLALEFPVKAYAGIASFHMRYDLPALSRITFRLLGVAGTVIALKLGYSVIAVALVSLVTGFASNLVFVAIARRLEPGLQFSRRAIGRDTLRDLTSFSAWAFLTDVLRMLRDRNDIWITAALLGSGALAAYYAAVRLVDYAGQMLNSALGMTTALFSREIAESGHHGLIDKMLLFTRINATAGLFVFGGFVVCSERFFSAWVGDTLDDSLCATVAIIALIGQLTVFVTVPLGSCLIALKEPRLLTASAAVDALVSITVTAVLLVVFKMGIIGTAIGMLSGALLARSTLIPLLHARLKFSLRRYAFALLGPTARFLPFIAAAAVVEQILPATMGLAEVLITAGVYVGCASVYITALLTQDELHIINHHLGGPIGRFVNQLHSVIRRPGQ